MPRSCLHASFLQTCLLLLPPCATSQGFIEWRTSSLFEGLIEGLGVQVHPGAFGGHAFDVDNCPLRFDSLFRSINPAFDAILAAAESRSVRKGVRAIGGVFRSLSTSCARCKLPSVSKRLSAAADETTTLMMSDVKLPPPIDHLKGGPSRRGHPRARRSWPLTISVNDVNVSEPLVRAASLWFRERYPESGHALAEVWASPPTTVVPMAWGYFFFPLSPFCRCMHYFPASYSLPLKGASCQRLRTHRDLMLPHVLLTDGGHSSATR